MWQAFALNHNTGSWDPLEDPKPEPVASDMAVEEISDNAFIFWTGDWPEDEQEQHEMAEAIIRANRGRVSRVILGASLGSTVNGHSSGPCGRCYCVIDGDSRQCEAPY